MRPTIYLLLLLPVLSYSQIDSLKLDSVKNEAKLFFSRVNKIELVELKPFCRTYKYPAKFIGFLGVKKNRTDCWAAPIIKSSTEKGPVESLIDTSRIGSRKVLDSASYKTLFNSIYESEIATSRTSCYEPRNGILFYDSSNKMIGFLEICFECRYIYSIAETPFYRSPNNAGFTELKALFDPELLDHQTED